MKERDILTAADVRRRFLEGPTRTEGASGQSATAGAVDGYWDKLLKIVPTEVIAFYLALQGVLTSAYPSHGEARKIALGALLVLGAIATWVVSVHVQKTKRTSQVVVTVLAYLAWVFATGGIFSELSWFRGWMSTAVVIVFGFVAGVYPFPPLNSTDKPEKK